MKCQKCAKPAVVHLTEVIADPSGGKRSVEVHLCLAHAVEAGLVAPGSEVLPPAFASLSACRISQTFLGFTRIRFSLTFSVIPALFHSLKVDISALHIRSDQLHAEPLANIHAFKTAS